MKNPCFLGKPPGFVSGKVLWPRCGGGPSLKRRHCTGGGFGRVPAASSAGAAVISSPRCCIRSPSCSGARKGSVIIDDTNIDDACCVFIFAASRKACTVSKEMKNPYFLGKPLDIVSGKTLVKFSSPTGLYAAPRFSSKNPFETVCTALG
jgi:hypothetical protein